MKTDDARGRPAGGSLLPPALIVLAAMLWGTDALWRTSLLTTLTAPAIVFWEHVLLVAATGWLLWRARAVLARLSAPDWSAVALVGVGASAVATVPLHGGVRMASPITWSCSEGAAPGGITLVAVGCASLPPSGPSCRWLCWAPTRSSFGDMGPPGPSASGPSVTGPWGRPRPGRGGAAVGGGDGAGAGLLLGKVTYPVLTALRFAVALPAWPSGWRSPLGGAHPVGPAGPAGPGAHRRGGRPPCSTTAPAGHAGVVDTTLCELPFPVTAIPAQRLPCLWTPIAPNQVARIPLVGRHRADAQPALPGAGRASPPRRRAGHP